MWFGWADYYALGSLKFTRHTFSHLSGKNREIIAFVIFIITNVTNRIPDTC